MIKAAKLSGKIDAFLRRAHRYGLAVYSPERGSTFDHWYPAYTAHHASSAVTSLATSPATDYV